MHHKPSFMAEYEAFSQLVAQGRKDEIDPLWIAIFCMVRPYISSLNPALTIDTDTLSLRQVARKQRRLSPRQHHGTRSAHPAQQVLRRRSGMPRVGRLDGQASDQDSADDRSLRSLPVVRWNACVSLTSA